MAKKYNLTVLGKRAMAIIMNNELEKVSALQLSALLDVSQGIAYKVMYYLQANGILDQDFKVLKNNIKEALKN